MNKGPQIKKKKVITIKKKLDTKVILPRKAITVKTVEKQSFNAEVEQRRRLALDADLQQKRAIVAEEERVKKYHSASFLPGQSGNPNGRPPGRKNWTTMVREALQTVDDTGVRLEDRVIGNIITLAVKKGNLKMIELLWAYIDGKPNQPMSWTPDQGELSREEQMQLDNLLNKNK